MTKCSQQQFFLFPFSILLSTKQQLQTAAKHYKLRDNAVCYQQLQCHPLADWDDVLTQRG